jgi:hypothetical protein
MENIEFESKLFHLWLADFDKGVKSIHVSKDSLFNKYLWKNCISTYKKMKLDHYLSPVTKINLKCIKDLNVRSETVVCDGA